MEDFQNVSETILIIFGGTLLSLLTVMVLSGRADELRMGIRSLFAGQNVHESYRPARLNDYAEGWNDVVE